MPDFIIVAPDGIDKLDSGYSAVKTLQFAADNINPGGVIVVQGGDGAYYDSVTIKKDFVRMIGVKLPKVKPTLPASDGISVYNALGVTIDKMIVINAPRHGFHATFADGITISHCNALDCTEQGFFTSYCHRIVMFDCGAAGTKHQHGFYFSDGGNCGVLQNLSASECARAGIQFNADRQHQPKPGYTTMSGWIIGDLFASDCGLDGTAASVNLAGLQYSTLKGISIQNAHAGGLSMWNDDVATVSGWGCNNNYLRDVDVRGKRGVSITRDSHDVTIENLTVNCEKGPCIEMDAGSALGFTLVGARNLVHQDPTQKTFSVAGVLSDVYPLEVAK